MPSSVLALPMRSSSEQGECTLSMNQTYWRRSGHGVVGIRAVAGDTGGQVLSGASSECPAERPVLSARSWNQPRLVDRRFPLAHAHAPVVFCSARFGVPLVLHMLVYGGSGEGRSSAARCVLRSHERCWSAPGSARPTRGCGVSGAEFFYRFMLDG